jgi:hypothetical protein
MGLMLNFSATPASAGALRDPQVPVASPRLQNLFNSLGESINVLTDQQATQIGPLQQEFAPFELSMELVGDDAGGNSLGVYNAGEVSPALMVVFPAQAATGWFTIVSFHAAPPRLVVSLFDANALFQGATTYLGADPTRFGFYLQGPSGIRYMEDARNPGAVPQMLLYAATGPNLGGMWMCWEDQPAGAGSSPDYADVVFFEECLCGDPAKQTSWGALKLRFR